MSPAATKVRTAGPSIKVRYNENFVLFVEAGMDEDEAAICSLISEAEEIARGISGGEPVRAKLGEAQAVLALRAMTRRTQEVLAERFKRSKVADPSKSGSGSEDDGGRE